LPSSLEELVRTWLLASRTRMDAFEAWRHYLSSGLMSLRDAGNSEKPSSSNIFLIVVVGIVV